MSITRCSHLKDSWIHPCAHDQAVVDLQAKLESAEKKESAITWLAAQMVVAMVAEDAERFHDGDFKSGVRAALEEIGVRFEMEARGEPSSGRGLLSTRAREALAAYDRTQAG